MITTKSELYEWLKEETKNCDCGLLRYSPFFLSEKEILYKHIVLLRKCEYHTNTGHFFRAKYYMVRLKGLQIRYGMHIPINVCEKGLSIAHVGPIIINEKSHIGKNCRIHVGVNIGEGRIGEEGTGCPTIGDNVLFAPGCKVFNEIHIANNVIIGANAVVNSSCDEEYVSLGGIPARIITYNHR